MKHTIYNTDGTAMFTADITGNWPNSHAAEAICWGALNGHSLRGADLNGSNLEDITFENTDLRDADLSGANMSCSYMAGTDFRGAKLDGANFGYTDLEGAKF